MEEFEVSPSECTVEYEYTANKAVTFDEASRVFTFYHSSDVSLAYGDSPELK